MDKILRTASDDELGIDNWRIWAEGDSELPTDASCWLWPLSIWNAHEALLTARGASGLWLATDADLDTISADVLAQLELIGINFTTFSDGRGLSLARLLRSRFSYEGELRAFGDLLPDVLEYMYRCGFDSFILRRGGDFAAAKAILQMQEYYYQTSEVEPQPLFLRKR